MDMIVGFLVGYYMGARTDPSKREEMRDAVQTIMGSAEFQSLLVAGASILGKVVQERGSSAALGGVSELVGDQLRQMVEAMTTRKVA
jgi:hypothetical protein